MKNNSQAATQQISPFISSKPQLSAAQIKEFLDESSEQTNEGNHFVEPLNSQEAIEKIMLKQTFLQANQLFDPIAYFGGLEIPDLTNTMHDARLSDMFKTPAQQNSLEKQDINQPIKGEQSNSIKFNMNHLFSQENHKQTIQSLNCNGNSASFQPSSSQSKSPVRIIANTEKENKDTKKKGSFQYLKDQKVQQKEKASIVKSTFHTSNTTNSITSANNSKTTLQTDFSRPISSTNSFSSTMILPHSNIIQNSQAFHNFSNISYNLSNQQSLQPPANVKKQPSNFSLLNDITKTKQDEPLVATATTTPPSALPTNQQSIKNPSFFVFTENISQNIEIQSQQNVINYNYCSNAADIQQQHNNTNNFLKEINQNQLPSHSIQSNQTSSSNKMQLTLQTEQNAFDFPQQASGMFPQSVCSKQLYGNVPLSFNSQSSKAVFNTRPDMNKINTYSLKQTTVKHKTQQSQSNLKDSILHQIKQDTNKENGKFSYSKQIINENHYLTQKPISLSNSNQIIETNESCVSQLQRTANFNQPSQQQLPHCKNYSNPQDLQDSTSSEVVMIAQPLQDDCFLQQSIYFNQNKIEIRDNLLILQESEIKQAKQPSVGSSVYFDTNSPHSFQSIQSGLFLSTSNAKQKEQQIVGFQRQNQDYAQSPSQTSQASSSIKYLTSTQIPESYYSIQSSQPYTIQPDTSLQNSNSLQTSYQVSPRGIPCLQGIPFGFGNCSPQQYWSTSKDQNENINQNYKVQENQINESNQYYQSIKEKNSYLKCSENVVVSDNIQITRSKMFEQKVTSEQFFKEKEMLELTFQEEQTNDIGQEIILQEEVQQNGGGENKTQESYATFCGTSEQRFITQSCQNSAPKKNQSSQSKSPDSKQIPLQSNLQSNDTLFKNYKKQAQVSKSMRTTPTTSKKSIACRGRIDSVIDNSKGSQDKCTTYLVNEDTSRSINKSGMNKSKEKEGIISGIATSSSQQQIQQVFLTRMMGEQERGTSQNTKSIMNRDKKINSVHLSSNNLISRDQSPFISPRTSTKCSPMSQKNSLSVEPVSKPSSTNTSQIIQLQSAQGSYLKRPQGKSSQLDYKNITPVAKPRQYLLSSKQSGQSTLSPSNYKVKAPVCQTERQKKYINRIDGTGNSKVASQTALQQSTSISQNGQNFSTLSSKFQTTTSNLIPSKSIISTFQNKDEIDRDFKVSGGIETRRQISKTDLKNEDNLNKFNMVQLKNYCLTSTNNGTLKQRE